MPIPVLVINRAVDSDRMTAFREAAAAQAVSFERLAAFDGHRPDFPFALHAELIGAHFWGDGHAKPGAIACFLSHRRAWQHLLDRGLGHALICEDDAVLGEDLSRLEQLLPALGAPDLVFANGRLSSWCAAVTQGSHLPVSEVLAALAAQGGPHAQGLKTSPGADCYLLSARGAGRLLALTAEQRIVCGVDWAMLWNALAHVDDPVAAAFPELGILRGHLEPPDPPLSAEVLSAAVSAQQASLPSAIRHRITRPLSELTGRSSLLTHVESVSTITLGSARLCFAGRSGPDPVTDAHRRGEIWDEPGLRALLARFPEGGTFVDIGAHLGNHAVVMGRLGRAGHILTVEPNAEIHRLLSTNLSINGLSDCTTPVAAGLAAWHDEGDGWLVRNRKRPSESMVKAELAEEARKTAEPVRLVPGDPLIAGREVHAIKIDTSGSEPEVIRGLSETLAAHRPLLLVDHAAQGAERIERLAAERSYTLAEQVPSSRRNRLTSLLVPRPGDGR